ncbi:venom metalloproteinase antarease-like TtrivMP_A [Centruroides sculpturatus]|uniref:venom metalloproteinase antarease-like TtrivMP_A n=1 Tax=Centruroides sculpturatus TaxID=218467 RepID=UPI000C6D73AC|nr:venom metalloproteinase antarease-like TtrivMP_A [Centruroides sculpturatus]
MNVLRSLTMLIFLLSVSIFIVVSGRLTGREEIVFPSIETLRSGEKRLSFRALNEDIELKLESAGNVFGEGFFVESIHDGRSAIPELNLHDIKQNLYKDKRAGASLHIEEKEHTLIRGIINHKLRIEPHESEARVRGGVRSHRIMEYIEEDGFHENDAVKPGANFHPNINKSSDGLRSGEPIYVEICIVTDTAFTKLFPNDYAIIVYVAILINGAQCRYDNLRNIRVILVFSGLKIVRYARHEPYIQNNLVEGHLLKGFDALNDFGKYMGRAGYTCDVIKLLTKLDLVDEVDGKLASGLLGLAYIGTVCDTSSEPDFSYKVGISEDDAHCFVGVRTVAHELAHNLGCGHDGDLPVSYIQGHPGSENCPWDDGYIMSYVQEFLNRYYFSSCCEDCIRYSAMIFDCLRNNNTGYDLGVSSEMPGVQLENTLGYSVSKYENEKVAYYDHRCKNLRRGFVLRSFKYPDGTCSYACRTEVDEENQFYYWTVDCLDGDMCDTGKRCFNGECI